jgi:photosystem II stability/assembly factor-like uncharacterized protein
MKKIIYIFFLLINSCLFSQSITQLGWEWLNPKPTHASLKEIKFIDLNTGYCIGGNGTILKTTNSGANWKFLEIWNQPGFFDYSLMHVFNKDTLIVIGNSPNIYKSTNGGSNWASVNTGSTEIIHGLYFRNSLTGYITGSNGILLKTTTGGNSWVIIPVNLYVYETAVSFPDDNTGYLAGQKLLRTTNGGVSWDSSSVITDANCMYFHNNSTGFIGANNLYITTNAGNNWEKIQSDAYQIRSIKFRNSLTGYANADNIILKTTNGGFNWSNIGASQGNGLDFIDNLNGFSCSADSYGSIIRKTTNGGANWINLNNRFESGDIYSIFIVNELTGYYGGTSGNLGKTTNGGQSWTNILNISGQFINSIYFLNENTGYFGQTNGANSGIIRKTTNAGVNWTSYGVASPVNAIMFADLNTGYALGTRNMILKTTNGGSNWGGTSVPSTWINGLFVLNSNTVMAVGSHTSGNIQSFVTKTTNGGLNWHSQDYNWGSTGNSVYFTDLNTGYVACGISGYGGRVFKTTDFGETWTYLPLGNQYSLNTIQFFDQNTGMISGYKGTAYKTTNAGSTWMPFYSVTDYHLFTMHCLDQYTCYYGGWYDVMLKTSSGGILLANENIFNILPAEINISQNYPNPFNPNTVIEFNISKTGFVKLVIYDVLGRVIETLIKGELAPGTHKIEWNASNYPSGVYFYNLTSGDFTQSKKMILIK